MATRYERQVEELQGRLTQLWRIASHLLPHQPHLAQIYIIRLMRLAHDCNIRLANSFYWNACSWCGLIWFGSNSCTGTVIPRLTLYLHLRSMLRQVKKQPVMPNKPPTCRLMSHWMKSKDQANDQTKMKLTRRNRSNCYYMVYECQGCGMKSIFDDFPLCDGQDNNVAIPSSHGINSSRVAIDGSIPDIIATTTGSADATFTDAAITTTIASQQLKEKCHGNRKKLNQLQRILQRSSSLPSATSSTLNTTSQSTLGSFLASLGPKKKP